MKRKKICVYAIAHNEEKFVDRWYQSMSEADSVVVLDTGSSDNTAEMLKSKGAIVQTLKIEPWRFDVARNKSLTLVPQDIDICVCTDLDEVFEPGWRKKLEDAWNDTVKSVRYRYTWSFNDDGTEGIVFWSEKIHANHVFKWIHPVHEVLSYLGDGDYKSVLADGIQLNHYPDEHKSRSQYLPLLELAVQEDPNDDRNMHYLGREYMYYQQWDKCIETLKKHLRMPKAVWEDERAASMRYIAKAYEGKNDVNQATRWLYRAIGEAPHLREPLMDLAMLFYQLNDWLGTAFMAQKALEIKQRPMSYISEPGAWGAVPYDLLSIAYYHLGDNERALSFCKQALEFSPNDERIKGNYTLIQNSF